MTVLPIENSSAAQRGRHSRRTVAAAAGAVSFASLGVPAPVTGVLTDAGITTPFPIQAATLPDALAGRDVLGRGRTGSGKTIAFSIPLVTALAGGHTMACRPRGLVLVPTRELASQVQAVLAPLAQAMGLTVVTIFGGTPRAGKWPPCRPAPISSSPARDGWPISSSRVTASLAMSRSA